MCDRAVELSHVFRQTAGKEEEYLERDHDTLEDLKVELHCSKLSNLR